MDQKKAAKLASHLEKPLRPVTGYFITAVETVRDNKARYAEAEARARQQRPSRPVFYDQAPMPAWTEVEGADLLGSHRMIGRGSDAEGADPGAEST